MSASLDALLNMPLGVYLVLRGDCDDAGNPRLLDVQEAETLGEAQQEVYEQPPSPLCKIIRCVDDLSQAHWQAPTSNPPVATPAPGGKVWGAALRSSSQVHLYRYPRRLGREGDDLFQVVEQLPPGVQGLTRWRTALWTEDRELALAVAYAMVSEASPILELALDGKGHKLPL